MSVITEETAEAKKQAKKQKKDAAYERNLCFKAMRHLLSTEEGCALLWDWLGKSQAIGHNAFRATDRDTAFILGMQNFGQIIMRDLQDADHQAFGKLLLEKMGNVRRAELGTEPESEPVAGPGTSAEPEPYA
jgi:hypothetical protein